MPPRNCSCIRLSGKASGYPRWRRWLPAARCWRAIKVRFGKSPEMGRSISIQRIKAASNAHCCGRSVMKMHAAGQSSGAGKLRQDTAGENAGNRRWPSTVNANEQIVLLGRGWCATLRGLMSQLKQLLYSDLARQYELEGRPDARPTFPGLLKRLLHFRFLPIVLLRASRAAMLAGIPVLPKLLTYANLVLFGLEVTPRCEIGPGIFFAHPSGGVIGARRIGRNVTVLQGVTLGAKRLDMG